MLCPTPDGKAVLVLRPRIVGATELWRIDTASGSLEQLTDARQYLSSFDAVADTGAAGAHASRGDVRSTPGRAAGRRHDDAPGARPPEGLRARSPTLNRNLLRRGSSSKAPVERWAKVNGHEGPGLAYLLGNGPTTHGPRDPRRPAHAVRLVPDVGVAGAHGRWHGGIYANPRGSRGLWPTSSRAATTATGATGRIAMSSPLRRLVGRRRPVGCRSLGVTGGSYGGYLTSWIVGHTIVSRPRSGPVGQRPVEDAFTDGRPRRPRLGEPGSSAPDALG